MRIAKHYLTFLLSIFIFISCKKDIADNSTPLEKLTAGSSKTWKYLASKTDGKNDLGECNNDDRLTFAASTLILNIDRGLVKCYGNETNQEFDYSFGENFKTLRIAKESYTIIEFSKTILKLRSIPEIHADGEIHDHKNEITLEAVK